MVLPFAFAFVFTSLHFSSSLSSRRGFAFCPTILQLFLLLFPLYLLLSLSTNLFAPSVATSYSSFFFHFLHIELLSPESSRRRLRSADLSSTSSLYYSFSPLLPYSTHSRSVEDESQRDSLHLLLLTLSRQSLPRTTLLCQLLV
jgi:hypothetical protein